MLDSIGDALTLTAGKYPDKTALVNYSGHSVTYREFNERVNRRIHSLCKRHQRATGESEPFYL